MCVCVCMCSRVCLNVCMFACMRARAGDRCIHGFMDDTSLGTEYCMHFLDTTLNPHSAETSRQ